MVDCLAAAFLDARFFMDALGGVVGGESEGGGGGGMRVFFDFLLDFRTGNGWSAPSSDSSV